jgi:hypothetical protein
VHLHLRPGTTFFSNGLPVGITLGGVSGLNLQTHAAGWVGVNGSTNALTGADLIQIWGNTAWVYYYFDTGTSTWQRSTDIAGVSASRNTFTIPAGQAFMIKRVSAPTTPAENFIGIPLPYTIQ